MLEKPWLNEPDKMVFWIEKKYPCIMQRNAMGIWCGYIGIDKNIDIDSEDLDVHGGITYDSDDDDYLTMEFEYCSVDDYRWIGFDCGHLDDLIPNKSIESDLNDSILSLVSLFDDKIAKPTDVRTYKDKNFVIAELHKLADQISKIS